MNDLQDAQTHNGCKEQLALDRYLKVPQDEDGKERVDEISHSSVCLTGSALSEAMNGRVLHP